MVRGRPREFDEDQALDAALQQFWKSGYEGTGLCDLEACTGLGRQSLYNAFGDKQALFEKVLARYEENYLKPLLDQLDAEGSPVENIHAVLDMWENGPKHGCLVSNSAAEFGAREERITRELSRSIGRIEQAFERALTRARDAGELPESTDPKTLARLFTTLGQGISIVQKVKGPGFRTDAINAARAMLG